MELLLGNCLDKLKELDDNSVDSIVTDPPYGLSFMGKHWDYDVPSQDIWEECLRVLKPGGHLLSFGGSRTYHRMAVRIEDAGFEIRDQIMWIYGSGFPKSYNIGKAVDKQLGNVRGDVQKAKEGGSGYLADPANRNNIKQFGYGTEIVTKGDSEWEGWGTNLKPAHEPIVVARKPFSEKTVVDNILKWGTGGINIDESRVEFQEFGEDKRLGGKGDWSSDKMAKNVYEGGYAGDRVSSSPKGRFPANIILDKEAGKQLDEQTGILKSGLMKAGTKRKMSESDVNTYGHYDSDILHNSTHGDSGGASRFFYCPKTSKTDRNEGLNVDKLKNKRPVGQAFNTDENLFTQKNGNNHPTVKPTDLMLYLIRLVTPKNGITLDPFMGSGSTGKAAMRGGFDFIGMEIDEEYMEISKARIKYEKDNPFNEETEKRIKVNENSKKFWE